MVDGLGIFLTSKCQKKCHNCIYQSYSQDWHFDLDDIWILDKLKPSVLIFSGGEPLMYDKWDELMAILNNKYPNIKLTMRTNGKLLDDFPYKDYMHQISISEYPGWNDDVVKKYQDKASPNIVIIKYRGFFKQDYLNDLNDVESEKAYELCDKGYWLINKRIYECCASVIYEKRFGLEGLSVPMDTDEPYKFQTKKACRYCIRSSENYIGYETKGNFGLDYGHN